jgi:hypothetical protein
LRLKENNPFPDVDGIVNRIKVFLVLEHLT